MSRAPLQTADPYGPHPLRNLHLVSRTKIDKHTALAMKSIHALIAAAFLVGTTAQAHHSFANIDRSKTVIAAGTVRTVEWTNPHIWVWLLVADANGRQQLWALEGPPPGELMRRGWSKHTVNTGDVVTVEVHPQKNGRPGGLLEKVTFSDGHSIAGFRSIADSK